MTSQAVSPVVRSLYGLPALIGDLVAQVGGLRSRPESDGSSYSKALEAPLPLNGLPFDDANALFRHLANEVIYEAAWLEQPAPLIEAWRTEHGAIVGLRAGVSPRAAVDQAAALVQWLLDRIEQLPEHALDALVVEVREIAKRHPFDDRPVLSKTAVCPVCAGALLVTPPRFLGDPQRVTCRCGVELDEAEYALTEQRYAAVQAREKVAARAKGVAARLAAKYGRAVTA